MKKIIWVLIILLVVVLGLFLFMKSKNNTQLDVSNTPVSQTMNTTDTSSQAQNSVPVTSSTTNVKKGIVMTDISSHNSQASCWTAISGKVYDVTSFITKHPGGSRAILAICGKDGTGLFDGKHGMDPRAKGLLPNFYLGDLSN
ncbi:MAG: cytochrome b5-like heme/steroid binding domain-containing protein [Candidatus Nomurabacteria bacterium]